MKKVCKYCGRIHEAGKECLAKPKRRKERTYASGFRSTNAWQKKSLQIRRRDKFLCQACLHLVEGTTRQYNSENLEVHHITTIEEDDRLKLEDSNLITLCTMHHHMADAGKIPENVLRKIISPLPQEP